MGVARQRDDGEPMVLFFLSLDNHHQNSKFGEASLEEEFL